MKQLETLAGRTLAAVSILMLASLVVATPARAAFVTTPDLDGIFGQASFLLPPLTPNFDRSIDIRYNAVSTLVAPDLLDISVSSEVTTLFNPALVSRRA